MKIYWFEMLIAMTVFGVLWAVLPWEPLTAFEGVLAAFYLLIFSFGCVALLEMGAEWLRKQIKRWN